MHILNHYIVHFKYIQLLFINSTSLKLEKSKSQKSPNNRTTKIDANRMQQVCPRGGDKVEGVSQHKEW